MTKETRVPMSKPNGSGATAKANVLTKDVPVWEAKGWKRDDSAKKEGA